MTDARVAVPADAPELVRLRQILFGELDQLAAPASDWLEIAAQALRQQLHDPVHSDWAGFVIDQPDQPGRLAACAVGVIERRLGEPANPSGEFGHVFNVCTDPAYRRRGYSRRCLVELLQWYRARGITRVDLKASKAGEPLYRELGFVDITMTALKLTLD